MKILKTENLLFQDSHSITRGYDNVFYFMDGAGAPCYTLFNEAIRKVNMKKHRERIDRVLAKHYGFTDKELDLSINYDIKYSMGRDAE